MAGHLLAAVCVSVHLYMCNCCSRAVHQLHSVAPTEDGELWEAALRALAAVLAAVPSALRHHESALTAAVAAVLLSPVPSGHCSRRQAALCLALLPQVRNLA